MRTRMVVAVAVCLVTGVLADPPRKHFEVKPDEFDPGHTHLVQGAWLEGIGCPSHAKTVLPNADFTGPGERGEFTDPACDTGDPADRKVEGLLLAKTGPSVTNFAAAVARVSGVKGEIISELGWDIRKPGTDLSAGPRGSHCGAGAPRWDIQARDGRFFFLGCNSPPAPVQQPGLGFVRMRWGGSVPLLAFEVPSFALVDIRGLELKSLEIVFDEGYDTGPDNFGMAVLDNIDVNGVLVGRGPTDAD